MSTRQLVYRSALVALLAFPVTAPIAAAEVDCKAVHSTKAAEKIDPEISAVFSTLEQIWRAKDFALMRGLWLTNLAAPLYIAEENPMIIASWDAFDAYFTQTSAALRQISSTYRIVAVQPGTKDQQLVAFELDWTAAIGPVNPPVAGWVRGQAVLEREGTAWKLRSYIEAPLAPIVYMGELYKLVACTRGAPGK